MMETGTNMGAIRVTAERRMPLNSAPAFENELDGLLQKARQLREAAKPFVALQHYFEHGYTGPSNDPLTITREDLRKLAEAAE
jgi:hypothetical protein